MKWFDYAKPGSIGETVKLLSAAGSSARVLAGGTDLLVQMRAGRKETGIVVDVKRVSEMMGLGFDPHGALTLGAAAPCYQIYRNATVRKLYPGLAEVASIIGGTQIQGRASIGGNLCNSAPSADSVPLLIALGARCRIASDGGSREVAVEDFCTGPGQNILQPGELVVSLHFPPPVRGMGAYYLRFTPRNEMDIAVAGAGVCVQLEDGVFRSARIALSSVAPVPLFVREAGEAVTGKSVNDESIQMAAEIARRNARPITDMRGTAEHRRHLCGVLTRRALQIAIQRAREAR